MRRVVVCGATLLMTLGLSACGSGSTPDDATSPTPSPTASSPAASGTPTASPQDSPGATASANSAVDRYCRGVDTFIAASKRALKDPTKADTEQLQRMAADLAQQAQALTAELIANPELIGRVRACTKKLADFNP